MNNSHRSGLGADPSVMSSRHVFRGIEYVVTLAIDSEKETFGLEVEDRLTADQWRGQFDARYIEDLTHKTGNFKQFTVFVNMLESALSRNSTSVSVDLLTYGDLESLRNQQHHKSGYGTQHIPGAKTRSQLHSKRYLIMTYTVEFDRIHYPLPLPYVGKPDPVQLQETVRKLREENHQLRDQLMKGSRTAGLSHLQKENDRLSKEKAEIEKKLETFQREVKHTSKANTAKEIRVLKKVVQNLENELMKEKSKYQRTLNKKNEEHRNLVEELEEIRANERNLRARCRSLTNELAVLKRASRPSPAQGNSATRKSRAPRRSISQERRPPSKQSSGLQSRTPSPAAGRGPRFDPTAYVKEKQRKQKEIEDARGRKRSRSSGSRTRGRSRSLSADRLPVKEPGSGIEDRPWSGARLRRTSSNGSLGSRRSSQSSVERDYVSDHRERPVQGRRTKTRPLRGSSSKKKKMYTKRNSWYSPGDSDLEQRKGTKVASVPFKKVYMLYDARTYSSLKTSPLDSYSSTPDHFHAQTRASEKRHTQVPLRDIGNESLNRSADMMDIDARLNALQKFMKENMP